MDMQYSKFFIAGILILPASCQQMELLEPPQAQERQELNIQGVINQEYLTRANDEGFVDGDRMGVFVVDYEGGLPGKLQTEENRANNMCYTYNEDNGAWKGSGTIYWRDKNTPVDVYGYYPFENVVSSIENYEFEVKANQNQKAEGGEISTYEASDFLWAKTSGAEYGRPITLTYGHLMAGVQVVLQKGEGFTDTEWSKLPKIVSVDNTIRKAVVNLEKGVVTADGAYDQNVILSDEGSSYRGVVVPQTVEAGKSCIGVTIDGVPYTLKKEVPMEYVSGKLHKFTVKVDKRDLSGDYELGLVDEQVAPWENDKSSHRFEGKAYVVVHVEKEGTLKECLQNTGADISSIRNLKITGKMTTEDFEFIREEMGQLEAINIKDVKVLNVKVNFDLKERFWDDDVLPTNAFKRMTCLRSIVLPDSIYGIGYGSLAGLILKTPLLLPDNITHIFDQAFVETDCDIELPHRLEYIGRAAFSYSHCRGELRLPETIKYIDDYAFRRAEGFRGTLSLPSGLEYLGENAFSQCGTALHGDIVIPTTLASLPPQALRANMVEGSRLVLHEGIMEIGVPRSANYMGLYPVISEKISINNMILPSSLEHIGPNAFSGCRIGGELHLPDNTKVIESGAFSGTDINGTLELPKSLHTVMSDTFAWTNISRLEALNIQVIKSGAFWGCRNLKTVFLGSDLELVDDNAFSDCPSLSSVICLAKDPPILGEEVFWWYDDMVLLVPEESLAKYREADGWRNFKYISAYSELAVGLSEITALNSGIERTTVIKPEGPWEVVSCPDWCDVSPMLAETKEEIVITVADLPMGAGDREGDIVFKLKDKDYTTYTKICQYDYGYQEDVEMVLQEASAGAEEIPIFIVGDGFAAKDIIDGSYLDLMNQQVEHFFDIEPYRTYKNYFTVSTAIAHSPESGIGNASVLKENRFDTIDDYGTFRCDLRELKEYVKSVSSHIDDDNIRKSLIIVMVNSERFGGNVYIEDDGTTICFCPLSNDSYPYDQRGIIQHFAGGRGFGKLAQEDTYHYDLMSLCSCPGCNKTDEYYRAKERGWYDNVSLSSKMNDVPWSHLIFHEKYSHLVDVYEGGLGHARGVYRSEINSCMNTYVPYYNTISRESIVRRIMDYAGKEYSFDDFVANDKIENPE